MGGSHRARARQSPRGAGLEFQPRRPAGALRAAEAWYAQSLAIRRALNDTAGIAIVLGQLGLVAQARGDHALARQRYEESLAACQEVGDEPAIVMAKTRLAGVLGDQGDITGAR